MNTPSENTLMPPVVVSAAQRRAAAPLYAQAMGLYKNHLYQKAIATFRQCLSHHPFHVGALHGLCMCLLASQQHADVPKPLQLLKTLAPAHYLTRFIEAVSCIRGQKLAVAKTLLIEVLGEQTDFYEAALALSHIYLVKHELDKTVRLLRRFALSPQCDPSLYLNLGTALLEQGNFGGAEAAFMAGLTLNPANKALNHNLGFVMLANQQFIRGWELYEYRYAYIFNLSSPPAGCLRWQGEDLQGKHILILNEQGFGDMLFASGYFQTLQNRGAKVVFECPRELQSLMKLQPHINAVSPLGGPFPATDYYLPAMSLPGVLGEAPPALFPRLAWLHADPQLIELWQDRLGEAGQFRVGIAWQGRKEFGRDLQRSIPLMDFMPLAQLPQVSLVSLQKGLAGKAQIAEFELCFSLTDVDRLSHAERDFHDTAAIMRNLELVITSDTSVAHLAGATGIPVWVILGEVADWRWFGNSEHCLWYPGMRLFRRQPGESWRQTMQRVSEALTLHLNTSRH